MENEKQKINKRNLSEYLKDINRGIFYTIDEGVDFLLHPSKQNLKDLYQIDSKKLNDINLTKRYNNIGNVLKQTPKFLYDSYMSLPTHGLGLVNQFDKTYDKSIRPTINQKLIKTKGYNLNLPYTAIPFGVYGNPEIREYIRRSFFADPNENIKNVGTKF